MSVQIAVRLPDDLAARVDEAVQSGEYRSRAAMVQAALQREIRYRAALRDVDILMADPDDELSAVVEWRASQPYDDLDA